VCSIETTRKCQILHLQPRLSTPPFRSYNNY
jgi:hypothetical protein